MRHREVGRAVPGELREARAEAHHREAGLRHRSGHGRRLEGPFDLPARRGELGGDPAVGVAIGGAEDDAAANDAVAAHGFEGAHEQGRDPRRDAVGIRAAEGEEQVVALGERTVGRRPMGRREDRIAGTAQREALGVVFGALPGVVGPVGDVVERRIDGQARAADRTRVVEDDRAGPFAAAGGDPAGLREGMVEDREGRALGGAPGGPGLEARGRAAREPALAGDPVAGQEGPDAPAALGGGGGEGPAAHHVSHAVAGAPRDHEIDVGALDQGLGDQWARRARSGRRPSLGSARQERSSCSIAVGALRPSPSASKPVRISRIASAIASGSQQ